MILVAIWCGLGYTAHDSTGQNAKKKKLAEGCIAKKCLSKMLVKNIDQKKKETSFQIFKSIYKSHKLPEYAEHGVSA